MGPPVRTVCVACLQSLEFSSGSGLTNPTTCIHCGHQLDLRSPYRENSTDVGFVSPPPLHPDAKTPKVEDPDDRTLAKVGRFLIRDPLGEGGYGKVYRAFDPHLERDVALKVLKPNRLNDKALKRFFREARSAARLDHPNIVGLHDAGRDEGRCWIAYQLVSGQTLSMVRDHERLSIECAVRIIRDLALGLEHAHERGVFHRDLKPANILIDSKGRARLTDFGLARRIDLDSDLTIEGTVLGTPHYMSPEAAAGRAHEADARSDVYSLGVILYELICGKKPSNIPSDAPIWRASRLATPPTPRSVDRAIPLELDRICMKALAFDPESRYPNAISLASALTSILNNRPGEGRPLGRTPNAGLVISLAIATSVLCLVLSMSLFVPRPAVVPRIPSVIKTSRGIDSTKPKVEPLDPVSPREEKNPALSVVKSSVKKPIYEDEGFLETLWKQPVVWVQGSNDMKIHVADGCQHTNRTVASRLKPVGDAESAVAQGYSPCKTCLKPLSLELEKRRTP